MLTTLSVARRWQFCGRCGQPMFEFYSCPDGHYGLAGEALHTASVHIIACPVCHASYHLLDHLDDSGHPVTRIHHAAASSAAPQRPVAQGKSAKRKGDSPVPGRRSTRAN